MKKFNTIDAHVGGEAVRLLVGGGPSVGGRTLADKLAWLRTHADPLRRCLMLEPRGHAGMHGALLTEPVTPGAHAGVLFMHAGGFPMFSGEGVIAAVTIALENGLIEGASGELLLDTPAGLVRARPRYTPKKRNEKDSRSVFPPPRVSNVALTSVPSFVFSAGVPVQLGARSVRVDIAFGGEFYAIADSESVGVPADAAHAQQLLRVGLELREAVEASIAVIHPLEQAWKGIQGTIFTAPPRGAADLRSATVLAGGVLRRSPGVAGTCALMAVLDAMGLLAGDHTFTHEGVTGTTLQARALNRLTSGEIPFVVPVVEGSAFTTGHHEFVAEVEEGDPLGDGFAFT
jgi:proline racemase